MNLFGIFNKYLNIFGIYLNYFEFFEYISNFSLLFGIILNIFGIYLNFYKYFLIYFFNFYSDNLQRFVTPSDFHATLKDFVFDWSNEPRTKEEISLFSEEVPLSRDCKSGFIPDDVCHCY